MKRPAAKGEKAALEEKREDERKAGAEEKPKGRGKAKAKSKAKAKASPKKKAAPSGASEAGDVSEKLSPKKRTRRARKPDGVLEPCESDAAADAAAKRRARVDLEFARLKEVMPELVPADGLKGRLSFTLKDPQKEGSSIGVILASASYYVAKAVAPKYWPTDCTHLQVGMCHVGFEQMFLPLFFRHMLWQLIVM